MFVIEIVIQVAIRILTVADAADGHVDPADMAAGMNTMLGEYVTWDGVRPYQTVRISWSVSPRARCAAERA